MLWDGGLRSRTLISALHEAFLPLSANQNGQGLIGGRIFVHDRTKSPIKV